MSTTGGKEVFIRDVAFERSVVNIGSLTTCKTPAPGNWDYSVIIGPMPNLDQSMIFQNAVLIGNPILASGVDLDIPVAIGLAGVFGAASTVIGAGIHDLAYSYTFSDNCVLVGAGYGANVGTDSPGSVVIGHNLLLDDNSPECILIGSNTGVPSIFQRSERSVALISGTDNFTPSYIYHDSPNSVLLGSGRIGAFDEHCFCANGNILDSSPWSTCILGYIDENCSYSIVMGQGSSVFSASSTVVGKSSTIGLDSEESTLIGPNATIGTESNNCVSLTSTTGHIGDRSPFSALVGIGFIGDDSFLSFCSVGGSTQDQCGHSINLHGTLALGCGGSVCIGFGSTINGLAVDELCMGKNAQLGVSTSGCLAIGVSPVVGTLCQDVSAIGHSLAVGDIGAGTGALSAVIMGANCRIGDRCENTAAIGFELNTGDPGIQAARSTSDIFMFGYDMDIGIASLYDTHQVLAMGGYHLVEDDCVAHVVVGFDNIVYSGSSYGISLGDEAIIGKECVDTMAAGHDVLVGDPAGTGAAANYAIGSNLRIGDSCFDCVAIGHEVRQGKAGPIAVPPNCTDLIGIGHSIDISVTDVNTYQAMGIGTTLAIGQGCTTVVTAGFSNTVQYGGLGITAIGDTILIYHGASNNHAIGHAITLGDVETFSGRNNIVAVGSNLEIQGNYIISIGFTHSINTASSDLIGIGNGITMTGSVAIALGSGVGATSNQFVAGSTASPYHTFVVRGNNGGAIDTLVAIDNPVAGSTGLSITFNDGATTASKVVKAAAVPPGGSLVLYMTP